MSSTQRVPTGVPAGGQFAATPHPEAAIDLAGPPGSSPATLDDGTVEWRNADGHLHRDDGPAVDHPSGLSEWWQNGQLHRDDGPAVVTANGHREWWRHGLRHREDGPAQQWPDGSERWVQHGSIYREDGWAQADRDGRRYLFRDGRLVRR